VGFGFHDDNDDWGRDRRGGRDVRDSDLFGSWTLGQENGNTCSIELKNIEWFGGYGAYVPAGCPDGFFSANRWVLSGNQLLLCRHQQHRVRALPRVRRWALDRLP
jgi:hypothetical protein